MKKVTAVIASVPWTDTESPLMAPGLLKSSLTKSHISSVALDLNQEIRQRVLKSPFMKEILNFFLSEEVSRESSSHIKELYLTMAQRILEQNSQWVCLSLFTHFSQVSCRWLCFVLKKQKPDIKIVIGGAGCFISLKNKNKFVDEMQSQGLIDYYISGDGEKALPALLSGDTSYPGINATHWKNLENLDDLPYPDYSDYDFTLYGIKTLGIWGSRGCVRKCTFCDVHEHWSKFQWRSADGIFAEMKKQNKEYGINLFNFHDSLINGNHKEYRKLIRLLADYNKTLDQHNKIRWTSFFIFRPKNQMSEEDWKLTADSGAFMLLAGVESFVEHIRDHMKKRFTNDDLDFGLKMAKKYRVNLTLLLVVGYVTETEQDHQEQLHWIRNNRHYAGNPVKQVQLGSTMAILPGTWVARNRDNLGIELSNDTVYQDWYKKDIGSTPEIRMKWHEEMSTELEKNGFSTTLQSELVEDNHMLIEAYIKKHVKV